MRRSARDGSRSSRRLTRGLGLLALAALPASSAPAAPPLCPEGMASIEERFCVDRYEASIELLDGDGRPLGLHPPERVLAGASGRAVSRAGVLPQAHVSRSEAQAACEQAGKRLCTDDEWRRACRGAVPARYPYGPRFRSGLCNDEGVSPMPLFFGAKHAYDDVTMNDPRLDRVPGTVARTGSYHRCTNGNGVFDMVGNLHEWTAAPGGTFRGGYFLDTKTLGEGCEYETTGHSPDYRDYSTGFRCCADPGR
ncbi:MAG: SUMF1/EgtB/PvdO family nonheme iron enzyme [Byssovorax sp.]